MYLNSYVLQSAPFFFKTLINFFGILFFFGLVVIDFIFCQKYNKLFFFKRCSSYIGMVKGEQELNLGRNCRVVRRSKYQF